MRKIFNRILSILLSFIMCISLFYGIKTSAEETPTDIVDVFAELAFPTAEGYGRFATGFRGGQVIEVTNLNDSGEGSLRWALEEVSGPRIVVFKVGGIIELESLITIDSDHDKVYVAGQTAPGDGITLLNYPIKGEMAEDIVLRYIRFRLGDSSKMGTEGVQLYECDNSIIDHCSVSWAVGTCISTRYSKNTTVQNTVMAEPLYDSILYGYEADGNFKSSWSAMMDGNTASFHHNLIINCASRNFQIGFQAEFNDDGASYSGKLDIRNNVFYNWYNGLSSENLSNTQIVNNYYKKGEASQENNIISVVGDLVGLNDYPMAYLSGNKMISYENEILLDPDNDDPWKFVLDDTKDCEIEDVKSIEPLFESYVKTETADEAYETVISNVGANVPARDYIDSRYIEELVNNKSTYKGSESGLPGIIDTQDDAGGYPNENNFKGGVAPVDTDHDGMPDEWEIEHGLDPANYYDACQVYLSDEGYTNIELYINELAGDPIVYSENPTIKYPPVTSNPQETATPEPTTIVTPEPKIGDVDGNGAVNAVDALSVLKHSAKLELLEDEVLTRADISEDGSIDAKDALAILKIAAKL